MFVRILTKYNVLKVINYLQGKNLLVIFDKHTNLKYKYSSRHFRYRGYYVDTVSKNTKKIVEFIKNKL
ncbi:MAG: hypothetical protein AMR96_02630 [Candidatus Adiutrix intracellularis]|nr:MAG: hypothetical protein AMR96_02630 [Candidatus Adiutrix intracellularis]MDR2826505.1 transposase [Candidatus Adiutrix intracellularis]